jgi:hypothetical protein
MSSNVQGRVIRSTATKTNIKTKAPSRTDQNVDSSHQIALEQLIPSVQHMVRNSISVDRREIFYYFKKVQGRECSCVKENETAEGKCPICYKTGWVGGYDKFGTHTEILDITARHSSFNILGDYTQRPVPMLLEKDQIFGSMTFDLELRQNNGALDLLQILDYQPEGSSIKYFIMQGLSWVQLTPESLTGQLNQHAIKIKVDMSRLNLNFPSPKLTAIRIRYNLRDELMIHSDWPHPKNSRALSEYGVFNQWQSCEINMDDTIPVITPEDWVYRSDRNERWKIIESDRYDPLTLTIGWNLTARLVQPFEIYHTFPL